MAITSHERVGKALEILKQPGPGLVISVGDKLDEDDVVVGKMVARLVPPAPEEANQQARDAIEKLRASCKGVSLQRLNSRDLTRDGRR